MDTVHGRDKELSDVSDVLQMFANNWKALTSMYMNFIITGDAGTGKTTLAQHIARIFGLSGILFRGDLLEKSSVDFVASYVGQSAPKTVATMNSGM